MGTPIELFIPFDLSKIDDDKRLVKGVATSETLDSQNQIMDYAGTRDAYDRVYKDLGSIREMHDRTKAAGIATEVTFDDVAKSVTVESHIVDDQAWAKVKAGVYKGYSVGGNSREIVKELGKTADGEDLEVERVTKWDWYETSLVDQPANPSARLSIVKVDAKSRNDEADEDPAEEKKETPGEEDAEDSGEADAKKKKGNPFAGKSFGLDDMESAFRKLDPTAQSEYLARLSKSVAPSEEAAPPVAIDAEGVDAIVAKAIAPLLAQIESLSERGETLAKVDFSILAKADAVKAIDDRVKKIEAMPAAGGPYRSALPIVKGREPDLNEEASNVAKGELATLQKQFDAESDPKKRELIGQKMALITMRTGVS